MSELGQNLKELVMKGIDAIGNTASSLASSTRQKVNEMALKGRRNELLDGFGEKVYEAWKNGLELPDGLAAVLREVSELDGEMDALKAYREEEGQAAPEEAGDTDIPAGAEDTPDHEEETQEPAVPVIDVHPEEEPEKANNPLSDAIDSLFDSAPKMDQMADKINSSLDEMGKQLVQFSSDFGKQLSDMADELMGKNDQNE